MTHRRSLLVATLLLVTLLSAAHAQTVDPSTAKRTYWTRPLQTLHKHTAAVLSLTFNPADSTRFASGGDDRDTRDMSMIRFCNTRGDVLYTGGPAFGSVSLLRWSRDGRYLLSMSRNHYDKHQLALRHPPRVLLWDPSRPRWIKWIDRGQLNEVLALAFSPDGKYFVLGGKQKHLELWGLDDDIHKIAVKRTLMGHRSYVCAVTFSRDGTRLASGGIDRTVRIWDHNKITGQLLKTLEGHTASVNALVFGPDGNMLVSGSSDRTLKTWNVAEGQRIHTLEGHTGSVNALAITPDGKQALSVSNDGTLRIWDVRKGKPLQTLVAHKAAIDALSLSADGKLVLTGGHDGVIRLWSMGTYSGTPGRRP